MASDILWMIVSKSLLHFGAVEVHGHNNHELQSSLQRSISDLQVCSMIRIVHEPPGKKIGD